MTCAFAAVPEIEIGTIERFEIAMPQAVLKNASDFPKLAAAIDVYNNSIADHIVSKLEKVKERFKGEITPKDIHYEHSELEIDRADERMVSLRAFFTLKGIGAVNEHFVRTMTIDCETLEEITPDTLIADKSAFVEATVRAIAKDTGIDPDVLRSRFDEGSIATTMGEEPGQLVVSFTKDGARLTYSLTRNLVGVVYVPLDTQ